MKSLIETGENVGKKPNPPPDDPEESARFVETAESVGADSSDAFKRAMKIIAPPKLKKKRKPEPSG